jgi:hypothetical protein
MSIFSQGLSWHSTQLLAATGQTVIYRRGATELTITATIGKTAYESTTAEETRVRGQQTDWICQQADLVGLYPPLPGDQVEVGSTIYEVQNLGDEPCYRDLHASTLVRIHVRLL